MQTHRCLETHRRNYAGVTVQGSPMVRRRRAVHVGHVLPWVSASWLPAPLVCVQMALTTVPQSGQASGLRGSGIERHREVVDDGALFDGVAAGPIDPFLPGRRDLRLSGERRVRAVAVSQIGAGMRESRGADRVLAR